MNLIRKTKICFLLLILTFGCKEDGVNQFFHGDPVILKESHELKKYTVLFNADRAKYGFTPLPEKARINIYKGNGGVTKICIFGRNNRIVQLKEMEDGTYKWVYEKQEFTGPKKYRGKYQLQQPEVIHITYYYGYKKSAPTIEYAYYGRDERILELRPLTLEKVRPFLIEWGYYSGGE